MVFVLLDDIYDVEHIILNVKTILFVIKMQMNKHRLWFFLSGNYAYSFVDKLFGCVRICIALTSNTFSLCQFVYDNDATFPILICAF